MRQLKPSYLHRQQNLWVQAKAQLLAVVMAQAWADQLARALALHSDFVTVLLKGNL